LSASKPSAEDHSRLLRDYADATEQFRATNEVLTALGRSTSDPDAVLDTVVESARRLCRGQTAAIYLIEDGAFRLASSVGLSEEYVRTVTEFPMEVNRGTVIGRAAVERRVQKVSDVLTDTEFARSDVQKAAGIRSSMSALLLLDGEVVGGLSLYRTKVDPFDDREAALLEVFAAQAAVVVHNVHLVRALENRSAELVRRVEQMQALSDVGQMVGSSLVLRRGAVQHHQERGSLLRLRRRFSHGVRRASAVRLSAQRLREQSRAAGATAQPPARPG
jgi:GAF domain-containing protein